uniref:Uncharacterized protein n=1 Tax=Chromera velia CCMP2878 TaxID=1169474 RepID=A0A0G4F2H8_9ALVE|mmetsp:Transcript_47946/g.94604  ORF Transcript_47946/g.94604 Transcript_47946/m.94604 type:complete len:261 (+) Transcript_47946:91-873(+)|eukprot:Cvel_14718.t1-p1 / transcript=Cvel_14718.t1 / gene=Cvel_14718 / organism=Chromera_velia_CCMP2878 / gene_product=hypothetical protein / transcript_product=hypothetical protein / location=Cvel_scaffold1058:6738-8547(+) / protein_length=260 / sequence_SO=supercontig / SO=protein_coding / is_pseudo=false
MKIKTACLVVACGVTASHGFVPSSSGLPSFSLPRRSRRLLLDGHLVLRAQGDGTAAEEEESFPSSTRRHSAVSSLKALLLAALAASSVAGGRAHSADAAEEGVTEDILKGDVSGYLEDVREAREQFGRIRDVVQSPSPDYSAARQMCRTGAMSQPLPSSVRIMQQVRPSREKDRIRDSVDFFVKKLDAWDQDSLYLLRKQEDWTEQQERNSKFSPSEKEKKKFDERVETWRGEYEEAVLAFDKLIDAQAVLAKLPVPLGL